MGNTTANGTGEGKSEDRSVLSMVTARNDDEKGGNNVEDTGKAGVAYREYRSMPESFLGSAARATSLIFSTEAAIAIDREGRVEMGRDVRSVWVVGVENSGCCCGCVAARIIYY
jgi:hypothetical protein